MTVWERSDSLAMSMIYKIFRTSEWEALRRDSQTAGSKQDRIDGFIHFSTAKQVAETAALHFADEAGLILAACDVSRFGSSLKWETSRGGAEFPHVYRLLSVRDIAWSRPLPVVDGTHQFQDILE